MVHGHATGVFSSRELERATDTSAAFRFIAANEHPDHDTIARFRRRFLKDIAARAKERYAREMAEHDAMLAARVAKTAVTGKKPGGTPPRPPVEGPLPTDQINLTDAESRIMPVAGDGFEQCYNAQAAVAADRLLIVAQDVARYHSVDRFAEPGFVTLGQIAADPAGVGASVLVGHDRRR